jgi:hypothetical protein
MTDPTITVALIVATPTTLLGILNFIQGRKNAKATQEVHLSINSRMTELLAATKGEATAQGREIGRNEK